MKKVIYFLTLMLTMVIINTGCEKPAQELPYQLQYPDWKNLTWVATDGKTGTNVYPRLQITINDDNTIHYVQTVDNTWTSQEFYSKMSVVGTNSGTVAFSNNTIWYAKGTFIKSGNQIILTTSGLLKEQYTHTFTLQINK